MVHYRNTVLRFEGHFHGVIWHEGVVLRAEQKMERACQVDGSDGWCGWLTSR